MLNVALYKVNQGNSLVRSLRVSKYLVSRVPRGLEFCLGSSLGSYSGCRKGHSQPGWALGAPARPWEPLPAPGPVWVWVSILALFLPLPTSQQIKILCICTCHNPQTGTAVGLKIQSSTRNPSSLTRRKALSPQRPPPWHQTKGHTAAEAREGLVHGTVGGSAKWLRRAAGVALQEHRQVGRAPFSMTLAAPVCVHDRRNERKRDVQMTGVEEIWGREKEKMACEGV